MKYEIQMQQKCIQIFYIGRFFDGRKIVSLVEQRLSTRRNLFANLMA